MPDGEKQKDGNVQVALPASIATAMDLGKAAGKNPLLAIFVVAGLFAWWGYNRAQDVVMWAKPQAEQVVNVHMDFVKSIKETDIKKTESISKLEETMHLQTQLIRDIHEEVVKNKRKDQDKTGTND